MTQPKRTKYRKQFKGRNRGVATRGTKVSYGEYGLKALEHGQITARQFEAHVEQCHDTSSVAVKSGSEYFQTSQLLRSHWKLDKVLVKVMLNFGLH